MTELQRALRRGVATFIFATAGTVSALSIFDTDVATWKIIVGTGIGAVANLLFRWAEGVMREPQPVDVPGGPVAPEGDH